ncbi:HlyD family secretion protein [Halomonas sp. HL-93]|uniref:HlyD family secretion protein n=1 Tax=Halomonas sp. HL-93 TaxID=1666906 RepID=UPI0006DB0C20|nr:HlyD family secretion protein [Halomonas sp. HL-93]KPQ26563.1 MAG: Multidrug resistance efflux pump [Halomonas sp. HL-93]SBR47162.1 Multidrug resistance efflux pump [Halomonas sp. HL-93]
MSPEQRFARWVKVAIAAFILVFLYFLIADSFMPITPEARVMRPVTHIAPELSAPVKEVVVRDHQQVAEGDVLFRLDAAPFRVALQQAQLDREQAQQDNARLKAELAAARASLMSAEATAEERRGERRRGEALLARQSLSRQQYDQQVAAEHTAQSAVASAQADIESLQVQLGEEGEANLRLRKADNALKKAQLDMAHTNVRAAESGVITNLQLQAGDYVQAGQPALALVADKMDIIADFREKSLRHVSLGDSVKVVLDGWPGQVFEGKVSAFDAGVGEGQIAPNGQLADIPTTDRWVRDAQRLRLHVALNKSLSALPASGARATVQLVPGDHLLAKPFAALQARLISWLHMVY